MPLLAKEFIQNTEDYLKQPLSKTDVELRRFLVFLNNLIAERNLQELTTVEISEALPGMTDETIEINSFLDLQDYFSLWRNQFVESPVFKIPSRFSEPGILYAEPNEIYMRFLLLMEPFLNKYRPGNFFSFFTSMSRKPKCQSLPEETEIKAQILSFGLRHANYEPSLFGDTYSREANKIFFEERSLIHHVIKCKVTEGSPCRRFTVPVQPEAKQSMEKFFQNQILSCQFPPSNADKYKFLINEKQFLCEVKKIYLDGRLFHYIQIAEPLVDKVINILGSGGGALLPSQDALLWYLAYHIPTKDFSNKYKYFLQKRNAEFNYKLISQYESRLTTWKKEKLIEEPITNEKIVNRIQDIRKLQGLAVFAPSILFYFDLFETLIRNLPEIESISEYQRLQFSTLLTLLDEHIACAGQFCYVDDQNFSMHLEYAIDILANLLAVAKLYNSSDVYENLSTLLENCHDVTSSDQLRKKPDGVEISSSGLCSITAAIRVSIAQMQALHNHNITIVLPPGVYYEIFYTLRRHIEIMIHSQTLANNGIIINYDGNDPKKSDYTSYLFNDFSQNIYCHILICSFRNNAQTSSDQSWYKINDIHSFINKQIEIREELQKWDPLILIIDDTIDDIYDVNVSLLLNQFYQEIDEGKLIVFVARSLNKQMQLGLDAFGAGMSCAYFRPDLFPIIHDYFSSRLKDNHDHLFTKNDPTLQLLGHVLKYGKDFIEKYPSILRGNIRFVIEGLKKLALVYDNTDHLDKAVFIQSPYTQDVFNEPWSFIIICVNPTFSKEIEKIIFKKVHDLLKKIGIYRRDGYAFARTSRVEFSTFGQTRGIRISMGAEPEFQLVDKFEFLADGLEQINYEYQNGKKLSV